MQHGTIPNQSINESLQMLRAASQESVVLHTQGLRASGAGSAYHKLEQSRGLQIHVSSRAQMHRLFVRQTPGLTKRTMDARSCPAARAKLHSFIARWALRFWHSRCRSLQVLAIFCTSSWVRVHQILFLCFRFHTFAKDYHLVVMNAPLPTFDMMAGQPIVSAKPVSANAAAVAMLANDSDVVHVQLLDRMIVVPRAVVNVSVQAVSLYPSLNLQPRSPHERH